MYLFRRNFQTDYIGEGQRETERDRTERQRGRKTDRKTEGTRETQRDRNTKAKIEQRIDG